MRLLKSEATSGRYLVAPSIVSSDLSRMKDEVQALEAAGADWLHVDVMDGDFVPNITIGLCVVEALKRVTALPLDCHLMIQKPERFAGQFVKAGAHVVSVHPEAQGDAHRALEDVRNAGGHPSLALKPATAVAAAAEFSEQIDMLLIMTVNPGFSGQKMIVDCLPKYAEARALFGPDLLLEIDGGMTAENAHLARAAGAQVLVAATAVFSTHDYPAAIQALRTR